MAAIAMTAMALPSLPLCACRPLQPCAQRRWQQGQQLRPGKTGAWVVLAAWGNVFVARQVGQRVLGGQLL